MTTQNSVLQSVLEIIAEQCDVPTTTLTAETQLDSLDMDSIERVDLTLQLEQHFATMLESQQVKQCHSIEDVVALVQVALLAQSETSSVKEE